MKDRKSIYNHKIYQLLFVSLSFLMMSMSDFPATFDMYTSECQHRLLLTRRLEESCNVHSFSKRFFNIPQ